jgi:AcrR family transcriptional regulator
MPRTKQRTPELRAHVLRVAMSTLARDGVAGFTTRRVAEHAATSTPAIYELFGDRGGLVRAMFFDGFRLLRQRFTELGESTDPRGDLAAVLHTFRAFVRDNPVLAQVMFSRPFTDFDPAPEETAIGGSVREFIVGRVARCVDTGVLSGDKTDIAHVLLALAQGMAAQETAGWLGTSEESADRRWSLAIQAALSGLAAPEPSARPGSVRLRSR